MNRKWKRDKNNSSSTNESEKVYFEKLTPNGEIDISNYESALDFALINSENKDITNIAMTGLYGSGKSSVLKTYEDRKKGQLTFLNISLAHYGGVKDIKTKNLEGKIVNQLLHQINYKKIPQTIFKIKDNTSRNISLIYSLVSVLLLTIIYGWFNFGHVVKVLKEVININWIESFITSYWFKIVWFSIMVVISFFVLYKLFKIQIDRMPLKSLKIGGNQIEILEKSTESYFDKFMNDVIYLFVNSGADVIVFEDLDRFDDQTIYEKLREINTLANKRRETFKNCNKLSFLYLIKDDMFKSKDRTKFFDFIIPIVPVMDGSNSYQKFLEVFEHLKIKDDFEERLLKKLALYIDDYRLLKNIANEYCIYKGRIGSSGLTLNWNKLLALIIYKNIFPNDFSALQYGKGFLNTIFNQKDELIKEEGLKIERELEKVQKDIEDERAESLTNIDELDALYLNYSPDYDFLVDNKHQGEFRNKTEFITAIKNNNFKVTKRSPQGRNWQGIYYNTIDYDLGPEFDALNEIEDYSRRRKNIENKYSSKNNSLLATKNRLNSQLENLRATSIKDLLLDKDIKFFQKISDNGPRDIDEKSKEEKSIFAYLIESDYFDLLMLLIREELIDEKYSDYMTYFYEGKLSLNDKRFIREILDNRRPDEHYKLDNFDKVLLDMTVEEFKRYQIKNISLTSSILTNRRKYEDYWNILINDLKENREVQFIYQVYQTFKIQTLDFFDAINEKWSELVINVINADGLSESEKIRFVSDYIIASNYETIISLNDLEQLTYYIGQSNLLSSDIIFEEAMTKKLPDLKNLGVKFENLYDEIIPKEIIREITKLEAFVITRKNIEAILRAYNKEITIEGFNSSNYSAIIELNEKDINNALFRKRFDQYFTVYLGFGNSILTDKSDDIVNVLNSEEIKEETKLKYIERLSPLPKIQSISNVKEKELWMKLIKNETIEATSENAFLLFEYNEWELSVELISFINSAPMLIQLNRDKIDDEGASKIFNEVVVDEALTLRQYVSILKSLNRIYTEGVPSKIPVQRMETLITNHIINFTGASLNSIRSNHSKSLTHFVLENFDSYITLIENEEYFDNSELVMLLQSNKFSLSQSKQIIDMMEYALSIEGFDYKDSIKRYILENNFEVDDLGYLTREYSKLSKAVAKVAYHTIIDEDNIEMVIDNDLSIERKLLDKLLLDVGIRLEYKQRIFSKNISQFSVGEVVSRVRNLFLPEEFINVLERRIVEIENTEVNLEIATQYKNKDWVTTVESVGNKLKISGRKILKK